MCSSIQSPSVPVPNAKYSNPRSKSTTHANPQSQVSSSRYHQSKSPQPTTQFHRSPQLTRVVSLQDRQVARETSPPPSNKSQSKQTWFYKAARPFHSKRCRVTRQEATARTWCNKSIWISSSNKDRHLYKFLTRARTTSLIFRLECKISKHSRVKSRDRPQDSMIRVAALSQEMCSWLAHKTSHERVVWTRRSRTKWKRRFHMQWAQLVKIPSTQSRGSSRLPTGVEVTQPTLTSLLTISSSTLGAIQSWNQEQTTSD